MKQLTKNLKNTKFNFTKNSIKFLIFPIVSIILAVVLFCTVGANLSYQLSGGMVVTYVADSNLDLNTQNDYVCFKEAVDKIATDKNLSTISVQKVTINTKNAGYGLVVKYYLPNLDGQSQEEFNQDLTDYIKQSLYSTSTLSQSIIDEFVNVQTFYGLSISEQVMAVLLATFVALILASAYLMIRQSIASGITNFLSCLFNCVFALSMLVLLRIPFTQTTFLFVSVVVLISTICTYVLYSKTNDVMDESEDIRKASKTQITNKIVAKSWLKVACLALLCCLFALVVGSLNVAVVRYTALALVVSIAVCGYSTIGIFPVAWSLFFNKKQKTAKVKAQAEQVEEQNNILDQNPEQEIVRN